MVQASSFRRYFSVSHAGVRLALLILGCVLVINNSFAQSGKWTVKAGQEMKDALAVDVKFRYPAFEQGNVFFKNGNVSSALLNFSLINEEMQFIAPKGDTLTLDDEATIKQIAIKNDTFYFAGKFVELISGNAVVKLAKKQRLKVVDVEKLGGYDQPSSSGAITSYSSITSQSKLTKINQRADLLLAKETTFYIGDGYNHFFLFNKRNLLKMFPRKEHEITFFLNENKTRYNDENDLKKLIDFLQKTL